MRRIALSKIIITVLSLIVIYFIFFVKIKDEQYNRIMCYYVGRSLTQDARSFEDKVVTLMNFTHENIHPIEGYDMSKDNTSIRTLLSGIGWCDQQARLFIFLISRIGITARLVYLRDETGNSPHSIAEALDRDGRWVLAGPAFNLIFVNKDGKLATEDDIKNDPSIIANNGRIKLRAFYAPSIVDPKFIALYYHWPIYPLTKEGKRIVFLEHIPLKWIRPIVNVFQDKYFQQIKSDFKDKYEFKMLKARGYQLLGYYNRSEIIYNDIIKNSHNLQLIEKAQFYKALLLKDEGRYREADEYISGVVKNNPKNSYTPYLLGLKARVLEKLGRSKEADEILRSLEYSLLFT